MLVVKWGMHMLKKILDVFETIVMFFCKVLLIGESAITAMAVAGRYISFIPDPKWSEEIVLTCMIYMALVGSALAVRKKTHIHITAFDPYLPPRLVQFLDIFGDLVVLVVAVVMLFSGGKYAFGLGSKAYYTSLPWLSKFFLYASVPLAGIAIVRSVGRAYGYIYQWG